MNIIIKVPSEAILEKMAIMEREIRMSKEYNDKCTLVKNIPNGWLQVTLDIQKDIANFFGFDDDISNEIACNHLRRAHILYPNNSVFKESIQVKYNKANIGILKEKDLVPDITLFTSYKKSINLKTILHQEKLNIFFGASHT